MFSFKRRPFGPRLPIAAVLLSLLPVGLGLLYQRWQPGLQVRDGRHDLRSNGIWLQHGWLGDDAWFARNGRDPTAFREPARIRALAQRLAKHGILYVFPHLCPTSREGLIAPVDDAQTERFLDAFGNFRVIPWVGGVLGRHVFLASPAWRDRFRTSVISLLREHPRLAGIHLNVEPLRSGDANFVALVHELRRDLPAGKVLSLAAFPPPTLWHPFPQVHWDRAYFKELARRADQMVVMMYDTAIPLQLVYQRQIAAWTSEVLDWAGDAHILLGVPAYDDPGVAYHHPRVENLYNALLGIHRGLSSFAALPKSYSGLAIYSEWEMDDREWTLLETEFEKSR
jgi:hypothetical protein